MVFSHLKTWLILACAVALAGCAAPPETRLAGLTRKAGDRIATVNPSLVMFGGELQEHALNRGTYPGWEVSRNDPQAGGDDIQPYQPHHLVEIRHREHLGTINGRPREFSSTITRTFRMQRGH
jgi:hypothetical protein